MDVTLPCMYYHWSVFFSYVTHTFPLSPSHSLLRGLYCIAFLGTVFSASSDNIRLWNASEGADSDVTGKTRSGVPFKIIPGHHGGIISQMGAYLFFSFSFKKDFILLYYELYYYYYYYYPSRMAWYGMACAREPEAISCVWGCMRGFWFLAHSLVLVLSFWFFFFLTAGRYLIFNCPTHSD